jgi:hypothetical protein
MSLVPSSKKEMERLLALAVHQDNIRVTLPTINGYKVGGEDTLKPVKRGKKGRKEPEEKSGGDDAGDEGDDDDEPVPKKKTKTKAAAKSPPAKAKRSKGSTKSLATSAGQVLSLFFKLALIWHSYGTHMAPF